MGITYLWLSCPVLHLCSHIWHLSHGQIALTSPRGLNQMIFGHWTKEHCLSSSRSYKTNWVGGCVYCWEILLPPSPSHFCCFVTCLTCFMLWHFWPSKSIHSRRCRRYRLHRVFVEACVWLSRRWSYCSAASSKRETKRRMRGELLSSLTRTLTGEFWETDGNGWCCGNKVDLDLDIKTWGRTKKYVDLKINCGDWNIR